jgi:calcineurin-like phosphoesterase
MTGARGGVLGVKRDLAVGALVTQMPVRFVAAEDDPWVMAVLVSATEPLRADSIEQLLIAAG